MQIHGLRPELQPEAVNKKVREEAEANTRVDKTVNGQNNVVSSANKEPDNSNRLLDVKG